MIDNQTLFSLEPLNWESGFFGFKTGKFSLNPVFSSMMMTGQGNEDTSQHFAVVNSLPWEDYELIQSKIAMSDMHSIDFLTQLNFKLAEGEVDFVYPVETLSSKVSNKHQDESHLLEMFNNIAQEFSIDVEIIPANEKVIDELISICKTLFNQSRFRQPWFKVDDSGNFYAKWIEKAVLGQFDDICYVIKNKNQNQKLFRDNIHSLSNTILGFVTLRLMDNGDVRIGLLGSLSKQLIKKEPVGKNLIEIAKHWACYKKAKKLFVATQSSNIPAMRLYAKSGATIDSTSYWMYKGNQSLSD
ncbi:hypothetical protein [Thorsellia kenyensis]|uniref:N-acetyltransferase domain-containing protein n=1 Tax=Thorsellia kenyensis TaxID=1549888 RepID=A0ABV6CBU4_9GAMM